MDKYLGRFTRFSRPTRETDGSSTPSTPGRYKRFIVAGDESHTALQTPLFYSQDADAVLLDDWTEDFLKGKKGWVDLVEDPVP